MNKTLIKNIFLALITVLTITTSFSACQRGSGCPYKFEAKVDVKK